MITGLHHVRIAGPVGGEDEARAFYSDLLGLREIPQPPAIAARGGAWWDLGDGRELHIGADTDFLVGPKAHPALTVASPAALATLAERLEAAGFGLIWDTDLPGAQRFYVKDPFGNRLELLAWTL
jgi:catechol 2,3-dioxygenase-like lactoylglutathione lyase family enzyme